MVLNSGSLVCHPHTQQVYCLPDGYEVIDSSLNDILVTFFVTLFSFPFLVSLIPFLVFVDDHKQQFVLKPEFTREEVGQLDTNVKLSYDLNGKSYLPGFIGLNNVKANDYSNVVVQALAHIPVLRDFFMDEQNYKNHRTPLGKKALLA